ncbi:hypothetical protein BDW59DRAFT_153112 [Aspergillus cavernicola]|uniref:Uncharacterized protein n=1 Tax=Aspergillus cavernicola TaxID=176166 RepID=A0ABR4HME1_9EURO
MSLHGSSIPLDRQDQRFLIQKYNITLEGPTPPERWPIKYESIFRLVWEADKVHYDHYKRAGLGNTVEPTAETIVGITCARVQRLVQTAYSLGQTWADEAMWRATMERLVLERFNEGVECPRCKKCYWTSELLNSRRESVAADKLCKCKETKDGNLFSSPVLEFAGHHDCLLVDTLIPEIPSKALSHQRIDLVLGLQNTYQFSELLSANPDIQATAIEGNAEIIFPFLVLESKAEINSVGFESIERQTAFANRALLDIQRSIRYTTGSRINPLVWFLAARGDVWRVYACVPDGPSTRIIELWQGTLLRHDHALQLLLIIDLIYDWARNIYKEELISRIEGQDLPERPSGTDDWGLDNDRLKDIKEGLTGMKVSDQPDWVNNFIIRSETDIKYRFRSISLPESTNGLIKIVLALGGTRNFYQAAQKLVALFNLQDPLIIRAEFIYRLHRFWTGSPSHTVLHGDPEINFASISFRAYFDYDSGQATQELSCIVASATAMEILISILTGTEDKLLLKDTLSPTVLLQQTFRPLRYISAPELTRAAAKDLYLHLRVLQHVAGANNWVRDREKDKLIETFWAVADGQLRVFWRCARQICSSSKRTRFPQATDEAIIPSLFRPARKPRPITIAWLGNGSLVTRCCCVIRKEDNLEDLPDIGRKIQEFLDAEPGLDTYDTRVLSQYARTLAGNKSPDSS